MLSFAHFHASTCMRVYVFVCVFGYSRFRFCSYFVFVESVFSQQERLASSSTVFEVDAAVAVAVAASQVR